MKTLYRVGQTIIVADDRVDEYVALGFAPEAIDSKAKTEKDEAPKNVKKPAAKKPPVKKPATKK